LEKFLGEFINWNGRIREVVKVASSNLTHAGYFTTFRDAMKPGEIEYFEPQLGKCPNASKKPIKPTKKKVKR